MNLRNSGEAKICDEVMAAMTNKNAHGIAPGSKNPPTFPWCTKSWTSIENVTSMAKVIACPVKVIVFFLALLFKMSSWTMWNKDLFFLRRLQ